MRISDWSSDVCSSDLTLRAHRSVHRRWSGHRYGHRACLRILTTMAAKKMVLKAIDRVAVEIPGSVAVARTPSTLRLAWLRGSVRYGACAPRCLLIWPERDTEWPVNDTHSLLV